MARIAQSALPARRVFSTVGIPVEHVVTVVAEILSYKTHEDMDYRKSKFVSVKLFWSRLQTLYIGSVNSERFEGICCPYILGGTASYHYGLSHNAWNCIGKDNKPYPLLILV